MRRASARVGRANAPYRLRGDLRAFLAQSDRFAVQWSVSAGAAGVADVGDMSIGGIDRLAPVPLDASPADDPWACSGVPGRPDGGRDIDEDGLDEDDDGVAARRRRPVAAFDLASSPRAFGRVALVYVSEARRRERPPARAVRVRDGGVVPGPGGALARLGEEFLGVFPRAAAPGPAQLARARDGRRPRPGLARVVSVDGAAHAGAGPQAGRNAWRTSAKKSARRVRKGETVAARIAIGSARRRRRRSRPTATNERQKPLCVDPRSARASRV